MKVITEYPVFVNNKKVADAFSNASGGHHGGGHRHSGGGRRGGGRGYRRIVRGGVFYFIGTDGLCYTQDAAGNYILSNELCNSGVQNGL